MNIIHQIPLPAVSAPSEFWIIKDSLSIRSSEYILVNISSVLQFCHTCAVIYFREVLLLLKGCITRGSPWEFGIIFFPEPFEIISRLIRFVTISVVDIVVKGAIIVDIEVLLQLIVSSIVIGNCFVSPLIYECLYACVLISAPTSLAICYWLIIALVTCIIKVPWVVIRVSSSPSIITLVVKPIDAPSIFIFIVSIGVIVEGVSKAKAAIVSPRVDLIWSPFPCLARAQPVLGQSLWSCLS